MNRNQKRRQRRQKPLPWFSLSLIAMVSVIVLPVIQRTSSAIPEGIAPRIAQTFNSDSSDRQHLYQRQLHPIDRNGFGYINELGGGVDDSGYYARPVPTQDAFGAQLQDGTYAAPMNWGDQGTQVLYDVKDGQIVRQDYYWGEQK
jgi:hypothetical protein